MDTIQTARRMPTTLDYDSPIAFSSDDAERDAHNRAAGLIHAYATARGIYPYTLSPREIADLIRADLDAL